MSNLKHWQEKIKEKRKNTDFRYYLKEIASWCPLNFQKVSWIISRYPDENRIKKIIPSIIFDENRNELFLKARDYNFDIDFFGNFKKLFLDIDFWNVLNYWGCENSDYADSTLNVKNAYISFIIINNCENVLYSFSVKDNCKDVINWLSVWDSSNIVYQSSWILKSFKIFYSRYINNSNNIWFSSNLIWCFECIFCDELENQKYCINNNILEKEEYFKQKDIILKEKNSFKKYFNKINKIWKNIVSKNSKWSYIVNSENIENWYFCSNINDWRNLILVWSVNWNKNMYDTFSGWTPYWEEFYWVMWANGDNLYNSINIILSSNIFYSYFLESCSFCIWCIGLKNKSYCILNKQYTKAEWEILADKIFKQMDNDWILWDFFSSDINPFYFNDTMAWLIGNFKKEEVVKEWYMWRNEEIKVDIPEWAQVINTKELDKFQWFDGNWNWKINLEILKKVIKDEKWNYYKIVKMEYDFLVKYWLPIPDIHWLDRMNLNFWV